MTQLTDAIKFACDAHDGQTDKLGLPYIFHPLRVMMSVRSHAAADDTEAQQERIVAVLHDVIEDAVDKDEAERLVLVRFGMDVYTAVKLLTRIPPYDYMAYIRALAGNWTARMVKIADLVDNLSTARLEKLKPADRSRLAKRYQEALDYLVSNVDRNGGG